MKDFVERLIVERNELTEKIEKLNTFMDSDKFKELTCEHKSLLAGQMYHMVKYRDILISRIGLSV